MKSDRNSAPSWNSDPTPTRPGPSRNSNSAQNFDPTSLFSAIAPLGGPSTSSNSNRQRPGSIFATEPKERLCVPQAPKSEIGSNGPATTNPICGRDFPPFSPGTKFTQAVPHPFQTLQPRYSFHTALWTRVSIY